MRIETSKERSANGRRIIVSGETTELHCYRSAIGRGVTAAGVLDALQNPVKTGKLKIDEYGLPSIQFKGKKAAVAVNPYTGKITTGWRK